MEKPLTGLGPIHDVRLVDDSLVIYVGQSIMSFYKEYIIIV